MKLKYCKHCNRLIVGDDYYKGFGFIYHRICYKMIYGAFDD